MAAKNQSQFLYRVRVMVLLAVFCLFSSQAIYAATQRLGDNAGVNDHPHNLSSIGSSAIRAPAGTEDRICIFCHTPHSASSKGALWNRRDPIGPNGDGTFPLYGQNTVPSRLGEIEIDNIAAAQYGVGEYPNGASRLCLSCHDGVTAIGEVINPGSGSLPLGGLGSIPAEDPTSTAVIDLNTSHPISFVYDATVRTAINAVKGGGADYVAPAAGILDNNTRMQCTSCHDPHLDTNDGVYNLPMWRRYTGVENADYEGTCSECHAGGSGSTGLIRNSPATLHPIP